ncbi:Nonribosomal peptide synthetases (NRPS) [Aspergillus tanneri]|uniref:Nonribosomal peptide synthetases (NRPS) n=1 Tax=Aspergillus tanneri TaxID=1220188 RepID=A0A5M9MMU7_9EURO|nr:Nonribosomal peptide synthetases (NRPS) [Aspergillus tanneri]KAA8646754.1 Nonribosomal peptide synthetases (NRPS) [Aspergillus tanneri]
MSNNTKKGHVSMLPFLEGMTPRYHAWTGCAIQHNILGIPWHRCGVGCWTIVVAAWTIVAAAYSDSAEADYCSAASLHRLEKPVHVTADGETVVEQLVQDLESQMYGEMKSAQTSERCSKKERLRPGNGGKFRALLVLEATGNGGVNDFKALLGISRPAHGTELANSFGPYTIVLECKLDEHGLQLHMSFDPNEISQEEAHSVAIRMENVLRQLTDGGVEKEKLKDIELTSEQDLRDIWNWNATVPPAVERCVHDLIMERTRQQPDAPAVCAWDGELTYKELDELSTRLAHHLVGLGVGPETIVPLCFEKSMWMPVAMLGVMKAGGASVAIDASQPEDRLRSIIRQVQPTVILSSATNQDLAGRLNITTVVTVEASNLAQLHWPPNSYLPAVEPSSKLYVVFTSGSTGAPKGAIVTHSNFSSAIKYQQDALGFSPNARVFDFASYSFDAAWSNFLHSVSSGACLCIPSESARKDDIAASMERMQVNYADLTPSIARLIDPATTPSLRTLILAGSKLHRMILPLGHRRPWDIGNIGRGIGLTTWVLGLSNGGRIAPVGAVGELWLEGPLVGQGYLGDLEKTATSFVEDPRGDLVRYDPDGTLVFVGRKDAQVKIRGQRVELGEVEHYVRQNLAEGANPPVVAETITPRDSNTPMLVVYLAIGKEASGSGNSVRAAVQKATQGLEERLAEQLPVYMVPTAYIPVEQIPMTTTGKTDRRRLREIGAALTLEQLAELQPSRGRAAGAGDRNGATTAGAVVVRADDSFLRIGGDSIGAMRLVGAAREQGLSFTVADVFGTPRLCELAQRVKIGNGKEETIAPFSLLKPGISARDLRAQAAMQCEVSTDQIKDAYPCTPLQEGLLAMTAKQPGDYVSRSVLELRDEIDISRFRRAWEEVIQMTPILRTRIIDLPGQGLMQVILAEESKWTVSGDLQTYIGEDKQRPLGLGTPLVRHALVEDSWGKWFFVWTQHHAIYDGWLLSLVLEQVERLYWEDNTDTLTPFQGLIKYVLGRSEDTDQYWQEQLEGSEAVPFPSLPSPGYEPRVDDMLQYQISGLQWPQNDITASTAVRTSWAILAARYTQSPDVIFGATVTGRQAPVPGVERMAGPTIATVPVRVGIDWESDMDILLQQVQTQAIQMTPYEQTGLQRIRQISVETEQAVRFQTLLIIQPAARDNPSEGGVELFKTTSDGANNNISKLNAFSTYAFSLDCQLEEHGVQLRVSFDTQVIKKEQVQRILQQLEHVLRQVCADREVPLQIKDVETTSEQDRRDIWTWNATVPPAVERCVHDLIMERTRQQPDAPAVCAWDGELTYKELDELSTRLAHHLVRLRVGPETIVPLCFEKSMWTPVAMLGVMKAGAASVAIDASQPEERLQLIIRQVQPTVILSSATNQDLAGRLNIRTVVTVEASNLAQLHWPPNSYLPAVEPSSKLYVVFTSGSTGAPKGAIVTHSNFSSAIKYQQDATGFSANARVFDFASYSFDAAWSNFLHSASSGACLCIPSESARKDDIAASMERMQPANTHSGGEQITQNDIATWTSKVNLKNIYGPAECTPAATAICVCERPWDIGNIGRGIGLTTWVLGLSNGGRIAPVGAVGELWLEGPLVGQGYLGDLEKTATSFVEDPRGDLVRYDPDGTLVFVGRKDAQVKIRGQRVELGEVEHYVRQNLAEGANPPVVAETITPRDSNTPMLVVYLAIGKEASGSGNSVRAAVQKATQGLEERLAEQLPVYMVPTAYIPVEQIPMTTTGKTDRRRLREIAGRAAAFAGERRAPATEMERQLQGLWSSVLGVDTGSIGADDSFLRIGGDSIGAMRLVGAAREQGLSFTVADVFGTPRLSELAHIVTETSAFYQDPPVFSLIDTRNSLLSCLDTPNFDVVDVYPVTGFQSRCVTAALTRPLGRCYHFYIDLPSGVSFPRLVDSCEKLWEHLDILRTVFVDFEDHRMQIVMKNIKPIIDIYEAERDLAESSQDIYRSDLQSPLELGRTFTRFLLTLTRDGRARLTIRLSHAQYDGFSLPTIFSCFAAFYDAREPPVVPKFAGYIRHALQNREAGSHYWRSLLQGSQITKIRSCAEKNGTYLSNDLSGQTIRFKKIVPAPKTSNDFTPATIFIALCACTLAKMTESSDVVFGLVVSGRSSLPPGLHGVIGPCLNVVPIRVHVPATESFACAISCVHEQRVQGLAFETSQFSDIAANSTDWPKGIKDFGLVAQFQDIDENPATEISGMSTKLYAHQGQEDLVDTDSVGILAKPVGDSWEVEIAASRKSYAPLAVESVLVELSALLTSIR